jgi:16S rRNA (uracil1498-N3)-methyltransferase
MPQFFIKSSSIFQNRCTIDGDNFHHLVRVRRARINDDILLRLDDGSQAVARIIGIGDSSLQVEIIEKKVKTHHLEINLCAGLLKGKKFELVIQKSAEIGISRIIPVISERTVPEIKNKADKKIERWRKIAVEASKQSMKGYITEIAHIRHFSDLLTDIKSDIKILAHPGEGSRNIRDCIRSAEKNPEISILIGPEGGFSEKEVHLARQKGWIDAFFGFTQMRSETAAIVLPAIIIYEWMGS